MPLITVIKSKYVCDVCKHVVWCKANTSPNGWCTTRKDGSNTICPACNPYLTYNKEPDLDKLKRIEEDR